MAYAYSDLLAQARTWAGTAHSEGRIGGEDWSLIENLDAAQSEPLFVPDHQQADAKPLIVAFMGGTGVGKSSLLNRLAGQAIAKAGVVRPTSREVTLYHHHRLIPGTLPAGLPLESLRISQHHDDSRRGIVWIDMPDFDSVELENRRLVLEWLPHIDVLLYVVSPERYRDQKAWQLLLAEGAKHAWLFVMNQSDRGLPEQFDDFRLQLTKAGFVDPLVFRTSCSEPTGDQFDELLAKLVDLSSQQSINRLRQYGEQWRLRQLHRVLLAIRQRLVDQDYEQLLAAVEKHWLPFSGELQTGLTWGMRQLASLSAERLGQQNPCKLWDDWAQSRFCDLLDQLILQADQLTISGKPLKAALQPLRQQAEAKITQHCELACRQAMLNPGHPAQRSLIKLTGVAETLLPLAAMSVVGYQVFVGYYHSTTDATAFLGGDFAIHSVLLIGLSWCIPFFLHKKLQPSIEKAAFKGLKQGFMQALDQLKQDLRQQIALEQTRHRQLVANLEQIIQPCQQQPMTDHGDRLLSRTLPTT